MNRDEIVQKLLDDGVIDSREAAEIRSELPPDASEELVVGLIRGEYTHLPPRQVASSLGLTLSQYGSYDDTTFKSYQSEQEALRRGEEARERLRRRNEPSELADGFDTLKEAWEGSDFENGGDAYDFVRDHYNNLKDLGVFSPDAQRDIERDLNNLKWATPSPDQLEGVVRKMQTYGATDEDLTEVRDSFPSDYLGVQDDAQDEADFLDRAQPQYSGISSLDPAQQAAALTGASAVGDLDEMSSGEIGFMAQAIRDGIISSDVSITPRERASYTGSGSVFDRSTGQVLSEDEWALVQSNPEFAAVYREKAGIGKAVQDLLDSGKFTQTVNRPTGPYQASQQYQTKTVGAYNPQTGRYETKQVRDTSAPWRNYMPIEDIAVPTASYGSTGPLNPWEAESYDYKVGDGRADWIQMSATERRMRLDLMEDNGLLSADQRAAMDYAGINGGNPLNFAAMEIWEQATSVASEFQFSPLDAIRAIGEQKAVNEASRRGGGGRGPTYSVPASLREIPDYKTLAQNTKQIFRGQLGRDMEDWELAIYADTLKQEHVTANERRIQIHKQAWDDAVAGGSTEVDFTAVEDPNKAVEYDIEEAYTNELSRQEDVEATANTHRLLMDSIATGQRMI